MVFIDKLFNQTEKGLTRSNIKMIKQDKFKLEKRL